MSTRPRIYLDHAATTPILSAAKAAMIDAMERWANPSSPHAEGRAAKAALEDARERIKRALGWDGELIFTSGATEAIDIALNRSRVGNRYVTAVEHEAVLRSGADATRMSVDADGRVNLSEVEDIDWADPPALLAVQWCNSETGVIQPIEPIGLRKLASEALLLVDASQMEPGWDPAVPRFSDFMIVSGHKHGGPPGVGALLVRDLGTLSATGGQERGYRSGTENLPAILGFAVAMEARQGWFEAAAALRARLERDLVAAGGEIVAANAIRTPTIGAYRMPGVPAAAQLVHFDLAGISVSAGSACSSGSLRSSHVLPAMGMSEKDAQEVIRVSIGPETDESDLDGFLIEWRRLYERRSAA